jgi:PHD/YefM family antitoxin component YafN of YafNO toxin-antitoxin module
MYTNPVHKIKGTIMSVQITYTQARANLASLLDKVSSDKEIVIIN